MDKQFILAEIKRIADENGGVPLGKGKFFQATGIKESDWCGKIWARWGDAVREAGFQPNQMCAAYPDELIIEKFINFVRELRHFPLVIEMKMKARSDVDFPWHNVFVRRFGQKQQFAAKVLELCQDRSGYEDVAAICMAEIKEQPAHKQITNVNENLEIGSNPTRNGYVYMAMLKIGKEKRYKIGKAVLVERRKDQLSIQLPEDLELIHAISTDDAYGIEEYWHKRFAAKNTKGEWFNLSRQDIEAFRRRKFM